MALSKREAEGFGAVIEELDLKAPVADWLGLTNQLIHPLLHNRAIPVRADINSVGCPGAQAIEEHTEPHGVALCRRSHDKVHIARVELVRDPATGAVERTRVGA